MPLKYLGDYFSLDFIWNQHQMHCKNGFLLLRSCVCGLCFPFWSSPNLTPLVQPGEIPTTSMYSVPFLALWFKTCPPFSSHSFCSQIVLCVIDRHILYVFVTFYCSPCLWMSCWPFCSGWYSLFIVLWRTVQVRTSHDIHSAYTYDLIK